MSQQIAHPILGIRTVDEMVEAFKSEETCRRLLEMMVWPAGRRCPFCGYGRSIALRGRDGGGTARPGLYQCQAQDCRHQFTVTTKTPMHATKLPLRKWLMAMWLQLNSDKGLSSIRLAEDIGVSQKTAWRIGHVIRLMTANSDELVDGIAEADEIFVGGKPKKAPSTPDARKGMQGHTTKRPVLTVVGRPVELEPGDAPGTVRSMPLPGMSGAAVGAALAGAVDKNAHLMTDSHKSFGNVGADVAKHDTVNHSALEFARGIVHVNHTEGFNDRVRRTVTGVFHHISPKHVQLYFDEIGFRWKQRIFVGLADRTTKKGRVVARRIWSRIPASVQMRNLLAGAVGREFRRTRDGSHRILSDRALFAA